MAQNNPALFDALMAGGCGGTLERWITSSNSNDYGSLVDAVEAFATAVDQAIPTIGGGGPSISQINLLQSISQGIVSGRNLASIDADTFADIAASIAAAFAEAEPRLNNVPVISGGGGGGGERTPGTAYVATSVATTGNGSPGSPFKTMEEAVTALLADAETDSCILVYPGDYSAEDPIDWSGGSLLIANACGASRTWQGTIGLPRMPDITISGFGVSQYMGLHLGDILDSFGSGFSVISCEMKDNAQFSCVGGVAKFANTQMANSADVIAQNIRFEDCELGNGTYTIAGGQTTVFGCVFSAASTFVCSGDPALLVIDGWTKAFADAITPTLTNMTYSLQKRNHLTAKPRSLAGLILGLDEHVRRIQSSMHSETKSICFGKRRR